MTSFSTNVSSIIDDIELQRPYDKAIIKHRFLDEISYYEIKRDDTKKYYNTFRFIVTTGSILLPAILSIGQMDPTKLPKNFNSISYWASWTISLMVTASNGFLQLFSLDKNYFSYSMVVEQLKTEGWQYFGLSGKYEDYPDHQTAYKTFTKSVESIKRKQVEQDFQNGKSENKKKKFNFKGEMEKFSREQNGDLNNNNHSNNNSNILKNKITENIQSSISDIIEDKKENIIENIIETKKETSVKDVSKEKVAEIIDNAVKDENP